MDVFHNSHNNLSIITERIIKTDEVLRLLDVKKKEVNKLDKKYKKLLEKFCTKRTEVSNSNTSLEKRIEELKNENEILQKNHCEYINQAENKYQSACQEIDSLQETLKSFKKKYEKLDQKGGKTKIKKLQDSLSEVQNELKNSLQKYRELETSTTKTILDLKHEHKQFEETRNVALKQFAENQSLKDKIRDLENKIESFEVEVDILNNAHDTEIMKIKNQYDIEKSMLENKLIRLKEEFNSKNHEEHGQGKQITNLEDKYKIENKLLLEEINNLNKKISKNMRNKLEEEVINVQPKENQIDNASQLKKSYENEKNVLEKQLQTLSDKFNLCVEKHNEEKKNLLYEIEKLTNNITELKNISKETCGTQTYCEDIYNVEDILAEMHDVPVLISPLNPPSIKLEVKQDVIFVETQTCSLAVGSDEIIPNTTDSYTDTDDIICLVESSSQTDHFHLDLKDLNKVLTIDSSTQTDINEYIIKEPKNQFLTSKIISTNIAENENKLLITLENSKLNLKNSVEQYMNNNSKYIIESSADCNQVKILEIPNAHISNTYIFEENHQNLCQNSCCQHQCHEKYLSNNQCCDKRNRTKYNSSDVTSSSDSEEDRKFEESLKNYNNFVLQKYYSKKKIIRKRKKKRFAHFEDTKNNKKHKSSHHSCLNTEKKINIYSDSNPTNINFTENTIPTDKVKEVVNFSMEDKLSMSLENQNTEKCIPILNPGIAKENIQEFEESFENPQKEYVTITSPEEKENVTITTPEEKEYVIITTPEENELNKIKCISEKEIDEKSRKSPFLLSKKQNKILRRGTRTLNNTTTIKKYAVPIRKSARLKKKDVNTDYNKKKMEIFGSDSGSSDNECNKVNIISENNNSKDEQISLIKKSENKNLYNISNNHLNISDLKIQEYLQNIPVAVSENKDISTNCNVSEIKNSTEIINNECEKQETKKIFKKPVKSMHTLPVNIIKIPENCINKDEDSQVININLAQKLISDMVTLEWDNNLMTTVVNYLVNKDLKVILKLIVNEAAKDFSQELDKSFSPPAPLLTVSQQKILVLISELEKNNLQNVHSIFLETLEKMLLAESRVEVVYPLTRLYVATCKLKYEIEKVRMLCCNAAYYMGDLLLPLMFIVLTTWGDVLPMADSSGDVPLAVSLVHVIYLKTCTKPGYNSMNLHRLLTDYYGYKRGDKSNEDIFKILFRYYTDTYSKTAYTAIVILCKNLPSKWTHIQINNQLLPLIESSSSENQLLTISLIQRLIQIFHIDIDKEYIIDVRNRLAKYVISTNL